MNLRAMIERTAMTLATAAMLTACAGLPQTEEVMIPPPNLPPAGVTEVPPHPVSDGSLWVHGHSESPWIDLITRNLRDIVFVDVVETTRATSTADTDLERESAVDAAFQNLFGLEAEGRKAGP